MFYDTGKVKKLMLELEKILAFCNRSFPDWFDKLTISELRRAANGIGADWMSDASRWALTAWYSEFAPIAFLHDVAGTYDNDGTEAGFERWNAYYFGDLCPAVWRRYAWYRPKRYFLILQARHLCFALKKFGWKAWIDAFREKEGEHE